MEPIITTDDEQTDTAGSVHNSADEGDLLSLFDNYPDFISPISPWLSTDISIVINETSSEGISAEYSIIVQQCKTTTLFDTGANMSVISWVAFNSSLQKLKLLGSNTCTVKSSIGTKLGLIEQCYLTFKLENKYVMNKFIVVWNFCRDFILGLNQHFNYKIGCNANIIGHQYMTHDSNHLWTSIPSEVTKPII